MQMGFTAGVPPCDYCMCFGSLDDSRRPLIANDYTERNNTLSVPDGLCRQAGGGGGAEVEEELIAHVVLVLALVMGQRTT